MALQKSPISILQEIMQKNNMVLPMYKVADAVNSEGIFICTVSVHNILQEGHGKTKKESKHDAAAKAIAILQDLPNICSPKKVDLVLVPKVPASIIPVENYVGALNEICSKNSIPYPEYQELEFDGENFVISCILDDFKTVGKGVTKKISKQNAAQIMIEQVSSSNKWKNRILSKPSKPISDEIINKEVIELYSSLRIDEKKITDVQMNITDELNFSLYLKSQLDNSALLFNENAPSIEESEAKLRELEVSFTVTLFVSDPLLLIFKADDIIPGSLTLIQDGTSFIKIKQSLLAAAVKFIELFKK